MSGKELFIRFIARAFRKLLSIYVFLPYDFYVKISSYLSYLPARASQEVGMVLQVGKENIFITCL